MLTETQIRARHQGISSAIHPVPGSDHSLRIITVTGTGKGPVLGVIGAVHGDELEGPLAIGQVLSNIDPYEIAGTLILLPVANPEAIALGRRCSASDGKNLARVFPGDAAGTPTEAMAAIITREVIAKSDALIDLHSAAVSSESPLFAGYVDTPGGLGSRAAAMAAAFGAPVVWRHEAPSPPGRTLTEAELRGIPAIYVEATGGLNPSDEVVDAYAEGVLRVMQQIGMIPPILPAAAPPLFLVGDGNTDAPTLSAPVSGILTCRARLNQPVVRGETCFTIRDIDGKVLADLRAEASGWPVFLRRSRWVERGELLMSLASIDNAAATAGQIAMSQAVLGGAGH